MASPRGIESNRIESNHFLYRARRSSRQAQIEALVNIRRLVMHQSTTVLGALHAVVLSLLPAVDALRSTVSKLAMTLLSEMAREFNKNMDAELDYVVPMLLKKAGEGTFLSLEADKVLDAFVARLSEGRVLSALLASTRHKNPSVRGRVAHHLETCCEKASDRAFAHPTGRELLERIFIAAVGFLDEGGVEIRTLAKRCLCRLESTQRAECERLIRKVRSVEK